MNTTIQKTNRITNLFNSGKKDLLSVYFTAGYPYLDSTATIIENLADSGADLVEIGIPFSDPIADGPTIQNSNFKALKNGITLPQIFEQIKDIRQKTAVPLILMGYIIEAFCRKCEETGIDGVILPDLPVIDYQRFYQPVFEKYGLQNIFLITPQTSDERIRMIDQHSNGFIYMVSSSSTTGAKSGIESAQVTYFNRIHDLKLKNPLMIGFGISNHESFQTACLYASGAIIGSAFINLLEKSTNLETDIRSFIKNIKGK